MALAVAALPLLLAGPSAAAGGTSATGLLDPLLKPSSSPAPSPTPTPTSESATPTATIEPAAAVAPALTIAVPASANFGRYDRGAQTISAQLGEVQVSAASSLSSFSWVATVSTSGFATGSGQSPQERIPPASVGYRSNPITLPTGVAASSCSSPSLTAPVRLDAARTAFSCSVLASATATTVSWRPEITIDVSADNVGGTYAGTITHSVA